MARLSAPFTLSGTFGGLVAYQRRDLSYTLVRSASSLSGERFRTDPAFANARRTASEAGGRSKAAQALRRVLQPLSAVRDHNWQGALTGALTTVQHRDTDSPWGQRSVLLSQHGHLLEGYCLSRRTPFETVLRTPLSCSVQKAERKAQVHIPRMTRHENYFPRTQHPYFRVVASLGAMPDFVYAPNGYTPNPPAGSHLPHAVTTDWTGVKQGRTETVLELQLPYTMEYPAYSLVLAVAISFGTLDVRGNIEAVKYCGSGRIVKVV